MITQLPDDTCPYCRAPISSAAGVESPEDTPRPGDVTICVQCRGVLVFNQALRVQVPTPAQWARLEADPEGMAVIRLAQAAAGDGSWRYRIFPR
jgi:hypothetical protein